MFCAHKLSKWPALIGLLDTLSQQIMDSRFNLCPTLGRALAPDVIASVISLGICLLPSLSVQTMSYSRILTTHILFISNIPYDHFFPSHTAKISPLIVPNPVPLDSSPATNIILKVSNRLFFICFYSIHDTFQPTYLSVYRILQSSLISS